MRYLAAQEATWAALVRLYKAAVPLQLDAAPVTPYRADTDATSPGQELASAVMLLAAAPLTLSPRQIELAGRIASTFSISFNCAETRGENCVFYVDLERPARPAQVPAQMPPGTVPRFIGSGAVITKLNGILQHVRENGAAFLQQRFGKEFGTEEKIDVIEHLLRHWGDSPPSRKYARTSVQTTIKVVAGLEPIRNVLTASNAVDAAPKPDALSFSGESEKPAGKPMFAAVTDSWTLTDISARGLGAGFARRPEDTLKIGSPFIFKLERSPKWCLAVVRRLQCDVRNQTEVGAQILARSATLVRLDGGGSRSGGAFALEGSSEVSTAGTLSGFAVLLHADPELNSQASLVFESGINVSEQEALMRFEDTAQRIRLGEVMDRGEGYARVAFDRID